MEESFVSPEILGFPLHQLHKFLFCSAFHSCWSMNWFHWRLRFVSPEILDFSVH